MEARVTTAESLRAAVEEAYGIYGDAELRVVYSKGGSVLPWPGADDGPRCETAIGSFVDHGRIICASLVHRVGGNDAHRDAARRRCLELALRLGAWYLAGGKVKVAESPPTPAVVWANLVFIHLRNETPWVYDPFWASLELLRDRTPPETAIIVGNQARGAWLYKQFCMIEHDALVPHSKIVSRFKTVCQKRHWSFTVDITTLKRAANNWAKRNGKPSIPIRRAGRKSNQV